MKVIMILADGMRPDSMAGIENAQRIIGESAYTMSAETVYPSVTLPCHISLFHSVTPQRHGTTTNTYVPQVRPINGLCEVLKQADKKCAIFYNWEEIRDVSRPNSLAHACFYAGRRIGYKQAGEELTDEAIKYLKKYDTDFTFIYFGYPDMQGHNHGWMTDEYLEAIQSSWNNIEKLMNELGDEYTYIITSDHGGHDRTHGSDMAEDMIIPIIINGRDFEKGKTFESANIIDLAPTVAKLLGVEPDEEWEGEALVK
ncbi:MAG: alkaline phosphatase family protein [Clostridia bacterium]|nr:alkaline phosphatase family protein [Clostridia bacterium]